MLTKEPRVQPPALDQYSDLPLYNTKAVARQTGVPAPTLRAWERRYGILSPRRGGNDYRLYSERDMVIVTWLRERIESGMTISQAIALLRSIEPACPWHAPTPPHPQPAPAPAAPTLAPAAGAATRETSPLSLARLGETLLAQLTGLHERAAIHTIAEALGVYSLEVVCDGLFAPVLGEIGQRWAEGHIGCAVEHFSSTVIRAQLESLFRCAPQAEGGPSLVVGCAPGNLHEIGPLILALFLRRLGVRVAYLGQNVDAASLASLLSTNQVTGIVLSAALPEQASALAEVARQLNAAQAPAPRLYVGGRAFQQQPALTDQLPGIYLGMSAPEAALEIKRRFAL